MGKVSAIVSAYYAVDFLNGRIENLMQQSPRPEIVIIAQEGSKEAEIAAGYDVKLITTPDIPTIYVCWNMGIKEASGEYITNSNSDDRLYKGALAKLTDTLDKYPKYAVAYGDQDIVEKMGGDPISRYTWAEGGFDKLMEGCFIGPMPMWRRKLHDKYGYFDGEMHSSGDYEFWLRIAKAGEMFFHVREPMGAYLRRKESAENREPLRSLWETARARGRYKVLL
jgi:GT2 family glycosyltransferase